MPRSNAAHVIYTRVGVYQSRTGLCSCFFLSLHRFLHRVSLPDFILRLHTSTNGKNATDVSKK